MSKGRQEKKEPTGCPLTSGLLSTPLHWPAASLTDGAMGGGLCRQLLAGAGLLPLVPGFRLPSFSLSSATKRCCLGDRLSPSQGHVRTPSGPHGAFQGQAFGSPGAPSSTAPAGVLGLTAGSPGRGPSGVGDGPPVQPTCSLNEGWPCGWSPPWPPTSPPTSSPWDIWVPQGACRSRHPPDASGPISGPSPTPRAMWLPASQQSLLAGAPFNYWWGPAGGQCRDNGALTAHPTVYSRCLHPY